MKYLYSIFLIIFLGITSITLNAQEDSFGTHTVKSGETLYSIAKAYFITVNDLKEYNTEIENTNIKVGDTLKIPKTVRNSSMFVSDSDAIDEQALFPSSNNKNKTKKEKNETKVQQNKTRKEKTEIKIAMMLPLFYENIDDLYFNQYNIEDKKIQNNRSPYKCFSYISFYEGARLALEKLEKNGCKISLYVFDVGEDDITKLNKALEYPEMKNMDLIIPLVFKNSFNALSNYAKQHSIPLVNPMSTMESILDNEYVFKIQPNEQAEARTILTYIQEKHRDAQVIVLFDDANTSKSLLNWYKTNITSFVPEGSWTMINYKKNGTKLKNYLKTGKQNIIINIIENKGETEKNYSNKLIQTIAGFSPSYSVSLFAEYRWLEYPNIDYNSLNKVDFHFTLTYLNDYTNPNFVDFVKDYRNNFKTEPDKIYAALGYDIMMYFVSALREKGDNFMQNPNTKNMQNMINHYRFKKADTNKGWQNETTTIYKLENYKIQSEWSH